ncbi:hypothetical protein PHAVU_011G208100 [Phaseolus vulgaris]|uniref:Peptidase A1 domain-containing protein n=1 Tax=Phaseolus vulgaris TaxID=3885 RepID=V7ANI1_PHAVU|nr:hypothetical protein PHAVU_011G208100g [Phaseolus vulgaris]ESW05771.1 hypothetical protein PHAVU_011G208100g [Phaseolus vulgaris]
MTTMSHSSLTILLLCLCYVSFSEALNGGFTVEIIHRDSPKSPLYRPTQTQFQRFSNAVRSSIHRANRFNQSFLSSNTVGSTLAADLGNYIMSYSVGTPEFKLFGIVDTGSDIIWLQCLPCKICYNQTTPIFNPSKSKTYKTLPCSSTSCKSVTYNTCSSPQGKSCEYSISYEDGTYSEGDLSLETLSLGSTNGSSVHFPATVIGCGRNNSFVSEELSSGIVGLGSGPVSLISQLSSSIDAKFSYCFAAKDDKPSKLSFGDAAVVSGSGTVSTPIGFHDQETHYYLTLEAMSVGNNRIEFRNSSSGSTGEGNIMIDSGTTLSLVPGYVYSKLESAVAAEVKLKRAKDPLKQLSLCYEGKFDEVHAPVITAHFRGDADVKLSVENSFIDAGDGIVCFAFLASETLSIFGNISQKNLLVGYDLHKKTVSFKPTDCSKQ